MRLFLAFEYLHEVFIFKIIFVDITRLLLLL